jgi:glycerophosphoryl diester phosphodiesterase
VTSICAHRGGALLWPENSLTAFRQALALPIEEVECDVHLSADGVAMVHHDATLDRTTEGAGPIAHRTAAELAATRLRGLDEGLPTLAALLALVVTAGKLLRLEIKADHENRHVPALLDAVRAELARIPARIRLMSFQPATLIAAAMPDMDLLIRPSDMAWHSAASLSAYAAALGCTGLGFGHDPALNLRGVMGITNIWRADTPAALAQAFDLAPHSITTDDPVTALTLRAARATSRA